MSSAIGSLFFQLGDVRGWNHDQPSEDQARLAPYDAMHLQGFSEAFGRGFVHLSDVWMGRISLIYVQQLPQSTVQVFGER